MTIFFASSEDIDFLPAGGSLLVSTSTAHFDPVYARCAVYGGTITNSFIDTVPLVTPLPVFYAHFRMHVPAFNSTSNDSALMDFRGENDLIARLAMTNAVVRNQINATGSLVNSGSWPAVYTAATRTYDVKIVMDDTNGEFTVWQDGAVQGSFVGDTQGILGDTGVTTIRFRSPRDDRCGRISELVIADEPLFDVRCATLVPDGVGSASDWTGDFTDVDEVTESQVDTLTSVLAGDVEMMNLTAYGGVTTNFFVKAVVVSAKARRTDTDAILLEDGSGVLLLEEGSTDKILLENTIPTNIQIAVRHGATDGFGNTQLLTEAYAQANHIFPLNPDTSGQWTTTDLAAIQAGVKSIT